jgi:GNAT superfamily N-acetyltransferase
VTGGELDAESRLRAERRWAGWCWLLHMLLKPFGYLEMTAVYQRDLRSLPPIPVVEGYVVRPATAADIPGMIADLQRDQPPHVLQRLWDEGHFCMVACAGDRVVAYDWLAFDPVQEEEYRVTPGADEVLCLNAYTAPDHRGKGVHPALLVAMLHEAARRGRKHALTVVSIMNERSWRAHVKTGWRKAFTVTYFRPYWIPGRRPFLLGPAKPPVALNWDGHSWFTPWPAGG